MSYSPASKISHTNATERATVLTEGKVMVTHGLGKGQMMKLDDWIILADGAQITEEFIPLPESDDDSQDVAEPEPLANGTKLRWTLDDNNYRVAVQTNKGVLQVKSVTDGGGDCHDDGCGCRPCSYTRIVPPFPWARRPLKQTLFADQKAWKASLPGGGAVTVTELQPRPSEKKIPVELSDLEKVKALSKSYKVKTYSAQGRSMLEKVDDLASSIYSQRSILAAIKLDDDISNPRLRQIYTNQLALTIKHIRKTKAEAQSLGDQASVKPICVVPRGKNNLYATINQREHIVSYYDDKILLSTDLRYPNNGTLYNNFAEMDSPQLHVIYRRRKIPITL